MSEPIIARARNIHEQQAHNRRMTFLLISLFVLLIVILGIGFDIFFDASYTLRIVMLPFVLLMIISGLRSFRSRVATQLWNSNTVIEDDDDWTYSKLKLHIILWVLAFFIFLPILIEPKLLQYFLPRTLDLPIIRYFPLGTIMATIVGIVCVATSLRWGPNSILGSLHTDTSEETSEISIVLQNVVKEISLAAGIKAPQVLIIKDNDPNAFAIGAETDRSAIVVTTGLLSMLSREELQGVVAHEISHIRNNDTQLMTTITVLFGAVLLLSDWAKKGSIVGMIGGAKIPGVGIALRGVLFLGWLLTLLFAPLIAQIVAMAVSRNQEYYADAEASELTRNPISLANALSKIEAVETPTYSVPKSIAHLCVVDPLGRSINNKHGFWADLFATHPPIKNRILLLRSMAYQTVAS